MPRSIRTDPQSDTNSASSHDDRYWLSLGVGYRPFDNLTFDFGYTHVFIKNASIDLTADQPGNLVRGNLSGKAEGSADVFGVQASWVF